MIGLAYGAISEPETMSARGASAIAEYRTRAEASRERAANEPLANVKQIYERAAATWTWMAEREEMAERALVGPRLRREAEAERNIHGVAPGQ